MPCCTGTLLKMGCITAAEIGTPASPTRSHFFRTLGMSTSQASRGSRPSFFFSSSHRRSVRVDSQGRKTCGSHAARWPRSSCCPILACGAAARNPPPNSADLVMAGGMLASISQAPLVQQPRRHPAEHFFHPRATCHNATNLAVSPAASPLGVPRAWPPSHTRSVCTARPDLTSQRVSSSGQVATAPSPAWLPHCVSREQGSLLRRAVQANLSQADPHDE